MAKPLMDMLTGRGHQKPPAETAEATPEEAAAVETPEAATEANAQATAQNDELEKMRAENQQLKEQLEAQQKAKLSSAVDGVLQTLQSRVPPFMLDAEKAEGKELRSNIEAIVSGGFGDQLQAVAAGIIEHEALGTVPAPETGTTPIEAHAQDGDEEIKRVRQSAEDYAARQNKANGKEKK